MHFFILIIGLILILVFFQNNGNSQLVENVKSNSQQSNFSKQGVSQINASQSLNASNGLSTDESYGYDILNKPMGVIVPKNTLKQYADRYNHQFTRLNRGRDLNFIGSSYNYGLRPVDTPFEKIGIMTSVNLSLSKEILNLYSRPIAPLQDIWEYQVEDKNGFIIELENVRYIENGDIVYHIDGKEGSFKAHIYSSSQYVYV